MTGRGITKLPQSMYTAKNKRQTKDVKSLKGDGTELTRRNRAALMILLSAVDKSVPGRLSRHLPFCFAFRFSYLPATVPNYGLPTAARLSSDINLFRMHARHVFYPSIVVSTHFFGFSFHLYFYKHHFTHSQPIFAPICLVLSYNS